MNAWIPLKALFTASTLTFTSHLMGQSLMLSWYVRVRLWGAVQLDFGRHISVVMTSTGFCIMGFLTISREKVSSVRGGGVYVRGSFSWESEGNRELYTYTTYWYFIIIIIIIIIFTI